MREILFRARTVSESEYMDDGEWVEGFYTCFNGEEHRIYTGYSETDCGDHYPDWFTVLPETVGQYTGLTDKNGKKIFEGDIIKQIYHLKQSNGCCEREVMSVIEYGISWNYSNVYGVCQRFRDGSGIAMLSVMNSPSGAVDCEVIGNIHDNPELLERSNEKCRMS